MEDVDDHAQIHHNLPWTVAPTIINLSKEHSNNEIQKWIVEKRESSEFVEGVLSNVEHSNDTSILPNLHMVKANDVEEIATQQIQHLELIEKGFHKEWINEHVVQSEQPMI